jgi:hypothetical protein
LAEPDFSAAAVEEKIYTEVTENTQFAKKREAKERSLDFATRRATNRRARKSRVAPLGMTARLRSCRVGIEPFATQGRQRSTPTEEMRV